MTTKLPRAENKEYARQIVGMVKKIEMLERGLRSAQLGSSTIEGGAIGIVDSDGNLRGSIGMQDDGTSGIGAVNGPPPPTMNTPQLEQIPSGISVSWNGQFTNGTLPKDWLYGKIYRLSTADGIRSDSNMIGTLGTADSWPDVPLNTGETYFYVFVGVNTSGKEGTPSIVASLQPGQVVAQAVLDGIIGETALANQAVSAGKIKLQAVGTGQLAGQSVTLSKLSDGSVDATKLVDNAVTAPAIAPLAVTSAKVGPEAVTAGKIAANAVETDKLAANSITSGKITAGAIGANQLAANSVIAGKIAADSISANELLTNSVTADKIVAGSIQTSKIAAGAVTTEALNALSITADKIAVNAVNAGHITAGSITASKLASDLVIANRFIAGTATGNRVEMHPTLGLQGFGGGGATRTFWIDSATGNVTAIGVWRTGGSGERVEVQSDGTLQFFNSGGGQSCKIENLGTSIIMRGALNGANAGNIAFDSLNAGLNYGPPNGTSLTGIGVSGNYFGALAAFSGHRLNGRVAPDANGRRAFFLNTNAVGADIGNSLVQYVMAENNSNRGGFQWPTLGCGIIGGNNEVWITSGALNTFGPIAASTFNVNSSIDIKENVAEISLPDNRSSWDLIEGAPAMEWEYTDEKISRPTKPVTQNGQTVKLRVPNPDISTEEWDSLKDAHPNKWIWQESEWDSNNLPAPAVRRHRFPIAEDLAALDPNLVSNFTGNIEDQRVDMRDALGIVWDSIDMLIKRNRMLERLLENAIPTLRLPRRPQRGDVKEGVGSIIPGRTRRTLDADGQIRNRSRTIAG